MSVAERRRGWPAWGSSLSNGTGARVQIFQCLCAPNPTCQEGRTAAEQGRTAPSEGGLPLTACLPCCVSCSPGSKQRCAAELSPTHTDRRRQCDNSFSRTIFGGKRIREDRKEGQGDQGPSPSQPGQGSPRGGAPAPSSPCPGSAGRTEGSEESPG